MIEDQKPMPHPNINTGDLVLVKYHTSKTFMPKYKTDFHVIRVLCNKVEVKDNNGKMSWYHISEVKKTDMVTKLICQLPDYDAFGMVGRLSFNAERVQDLGWTANNQYFKFNPDHVLDPPVKKQRSHPMQLRSASLNNIDLSFASLNIGQLMQNNNLICCFLLEMHF